MIKPDEVEVDIVLTMSLHTKIKVDDYEEEMDWDDDEGRIIVHNYENCNLSKQAMDQIKIPTEMYEFKDWTIDDFQVFQS